MTALAHSTPPTRVPHAELEHVFVYRGQLIIVEVPPRREAFGRSWPMIAGTTYRNGGVDRLTSAAMRSAMSHDEAQTLPFDVELEDLLLRTAHRIDETIKSGETGLRGHRSYQLDMQVRFLRGDFDEQLGS